MDSHAPPSSGRPPSGCGTGRWLLFYNGAENQAGQGSESYYRCTVPKCLIGETGSDPPRRHSISTPLERN